MNDTENEADTPVDGPVHWVDERYTTGGPGPQGEPDTVDETASMVGRAVEPHEALNLSAEQTSDSPVESDPSRGEQTTDDEDEAERPAKSALKADWVAYAISQGEDPDDAEASTKDALIEKYGD